MNYTIVFMTQKTRKVIEVQNISFACYAEAGIWAVRESMKRGNDVIYCVAPRNGIYIF
jgi:uncharacterized protein YpmB